MSSRRTWPLPVLVIGPWLREAPEECSLGTSPTKEPMELPVNRCQSPISTASANPVKVATPRRQPSRRTTAVYSRVRGGRDDLLVETVASGGGGQHRVVVALEGRLGQRVGEPLPAQPQSCLPVHASPS